MFGSLLVKLSSILQDLISRVILPIYYYKLIAMYLFKYFLISSLLLLFCQINGSPQSNPMVNTKLGLVRGIKATDGNYSMFMGIPYATVDENNPFGPSIPYPEFEDVFNANDSTAACPQANNKGTLDCLKLHISVPESASSKNLLPVMVWIHGGGFTSRAAGIEGLGPKFFIRHEIIIVSLNYRLGPYGFMCLNDPQVPGNQGLKDLLLALRWINDNIEAFGGDVDRITLAGHSSGSVSVDLFLLYNEENLFSKAVLQSGTGLAPWAVKLPDVTAAVKIAAQLGFEGNNTEALKFLATTDSKLVIAAAEKADLEFDPCVEKYTNDETFIPIDPKYVKAANPEIPVLIGTMEDELANRFAHKDMASTGNLFNENLVTNFDLDDNDLYRTEKILRHYYIGDKEITDDVKVGIINFNSDFLFQYPTERSIRNYLEDGADVYRYFFTYVGERNVARIRDNVTFGGPTHGDELGYLFDVASLSEVPETKENSLMIDRMTTMWANFIKYGLQDFRCVWCRKCVHAACKPGWRASCSLGPARASIVPPTRLHSVGPDDAWVPDRPANASPLIVFVNSRSGDNQGVKFLRRFKQLLNPAQVFELSGGGPRLGLRLFRHFAPIRVLVCSGDGSVGWVLQEVDKLDMHRQVQTAVLPLGTGNDLARVLGWGASCDDAANLQLLIERYERASTKMLDRWSIMTFERSLTAPPPPPAPPDLLEENTLLKNLQDIMQAGEVSCVASTSLRAGCAQLAAVGERAGGGAARAAHRLRRAVSLLLHARAHLAHDHTRCKSWEPPETTSDSEPEAQPVAEKGSIEKTEKEQLNWAARGCALAGRADSVRKALRSLVRTLTQIYPQEQDSCDTCTSEAEAGMEAIEESTTRTSLDALPVPRAFADSRRSSAASAVSAASMHPENIPDVDEDIAKLLCTNPPNQINVDKPDRTKASSASPQDRLSLSNLSSCDTSSCKNLFRPDTERTFNSSSLTIPNLVVSDDSDKRDSLIQGETYESDQLTIIDIDKPYTDDVHFNELSARVSPVSGECTPERKLSSVDLEIDVSSSEGSNISDDFSLISEINDAKPGDIDEAGGMTHIDSPEISDTTYANSETLHGESIMDDISSMLGQDVLMAMMGKNGENETYTDDTTLFTSDTVSDIAMDSRNPSLEKNNEAKLKYKSKIKKPKELEVEKFGFENRVFYIENVTKVEEQIKYCSLAHFEEGNDIARRSFKKQLKKSIKKRVTDDQSLKNLLPKTAEEKFKEDDTSRLLGSQKFCPESPKPKDIYRDTPKDQLPAFPQVSVVVEPPSPSHSEDKKSIKTIASRMASVLSDLFDQGGDTLSVNSPEPNLGTARERRQSDNPKLLGSDPEYGQFLSCSPAATRRISCGSLFKPGEPDKLSTSVSSIWGEGGTMGAIGGHSNASEKAKKLPIINPLVQLPAWPHVTQGFISQCLLANADALCAAVSPLMDPDDTLLEGFYERAVMNNYFGIGIDAKITLDFHNKREEHPEKCRSRARNYMWYGVLGSKEWVNRTYRHLGQRVQLECDGQRIPLPELQGIVVLNIPSFMGGTNFWGGTRGDDLFLAPSFDDRILEVVAVFGSAQMAASRLINLQKHRIAQCRAVQINILGDECVPVQVDGEAWLQPPGCVRIIHKNRAQMLCRSRALETSMRTWDEKLQMKAHALAGTGTATGTGGSSTPAPATQSMRTQLSQSESAQLLALLDDVNTVVKFVKLSCISESGVSGGVSSAVSTARRVSAQADALQDADGKLLPAPQLRRLLATLVESCQELIESGAISGAGSSAAASLRAHLSRVEMHDGHAYLHCDEIPKKGGAGRWLRGRRSMSEGGTTATYTAAQVRSWGIKEVQTWLESLQLGEYADAFSKHDVTGRELLSLARRDLRDLGITKVGHVKRILQAVKELQ